jgi:hypothetical protein
VQKEDKMVSAGTILGGAAGGAAIAIVIKAVDEFSKTFADAEVSTQALGKSVMGIGTGLAAIGVVGVYAFGSMANEAAIAGDIQDNFNRLVGSEGTKVMKKFADATLNTVSKVDMMATINTSVTRGLKAETIPVLADFAMRLKDAGQIQGSVTDAINDMTVAIATGRTITLKRMGVILDENTVLQEYALRQWQAEAATRGAIVAAKIGDEVLKKKISTYTEVQKQEIMQQAILEGIKKSTEMLAVPTSDFADQLDQMKASFTNLRIEIGNAVAPIFTVLIGIIQKIIAWFSGLSDKTKQVIIISALLVVGLTLLVGVILLVTGAVMALNIALLPYILIIAAIVAAIVILVAIIIYWKDILNFLYNSVLIPVWNFLKSFFAPEIEAVSLVIRLLGDAFNWLKDSVIKPVWDFLVGLYNWLKNTFIEIIQRVIDLISGASSASSGFGGGKFSTTSVGKVLSGTKKDFVMRPGQPAVNFSPDDTLLGVKDVSSLRGKDKIINITITGDIYGVDAKEISKSLVNELRMKISI